MARAAPQHARLPAALRSVRAAGGLLPFAVYVTLFLLLPAGAIVVGAFRTPTGHATLDNVRIASRGVYRHGFVTSIELSLIASILPAILGVLLARAIDASPEESVLRRVVVTASGVFANFGGVPLAFIFISTLGTTGQATVWLNHLGVHLNTNGFSLYTLTGVAIVYLYFQIPLMVLVSLPALQGLKPEWREASKNLGGGSLHYWRHIAAPALAPSVLGATLLLFGSAFSAYATADALTSGSIPLTSIQIGSFLNGDVIPGQENVGKALGFGMILVIAVLMGFYTVLQRRASRWAR
jgi:putative spermidine/putrescine transport system permease protein